MTFVGIIYEMKCKDCNHAEHIYVGFIEETKEHYRPFYCSGCNKIEHVAYPHEELEKGAIVRYCQYTGAKLVELKLEKENVINTENKAEVFFSVPYIANVELPCPKCKGENISISWAGMT